MSMPSIECSVQPRPGFVQPLEASETGSDRICRIIHSGGVHQVLSWIDLPGRSPLSRVGDVSLLLNGTYSGEDLLLDFNPRPNHRLQDFLPDTLCPVSGVVKEVSSLIDGLSATSLRNFAASALLAPEVHLKFWTCPASSGYHHAYSGGLAEHSLEVANSIASSVRIPQFWRELGVVYGLLHDYGKPWCLDQTLRDPNDFRKHGERGLYYLQPALAGLRAEDSLLGALMEELLGGKRCPRDNPYPLAIRAIVKGFDQMSCELTRGLVMTERATHLDDMLMPF